MYCAEKSSGSFVVTSGYCSVMLQFFKEILNQMPRFIEKCVIIPLNFAIGFWWDNNLFSCQN